MTPMGRGYLVSVVAIVLGVACAVPPASTTSQIEPSAGSSAEATAGGFSLEFHVPRQSLLAQLAAEGYACTVGSADGIGMVGTQCIRADDPAHGYFITGFGDDVGAVSLRTNDREELMSFLAQTGNEIADWVETQLASAPGEPVEACKNFSEATVYVDVRPGATAGTSEMQLGLAAVDWPAMSCTESPVEAGTHSADLFGIQVEYTVDEGWSTTEAVSWRIALLRDHGALLIERYGGQVISDRCTTPVTTQSLPSSDELVDWLSTYAGLTVSEQAQSLVGEWPARVLDIKAGVIPKCPNEKNAYATLWVPDTTDTGVDAVEGAEGLASGEMMRVVLVDHPHGPLILSIVAGDKSSAADLQHLIDLSEPVIRSIGFPV